jgi:hypothetical protein
VAYCHPGKYDQNQTIDAAKHWEEVSKEHKTPLDGDIWIEDPAFLLPTVDCI